MFSITAFAFLSLTGGILALWAIWARAITRWRLVSLLGFLMSILISGGVILSVQGWSSPCYLLLPGKYSLLGYTISDRIDLFLSTDYGPKVCYINYSDGDAEKLQKNDEDGSGSEFEIGWGNGNGQWGIPGLDGENSFGEIHAKPPAHKEKPADEEPPVFGE